MSLLKFDVVEEEAALRLIGLALEEDLGERGDLTSRALLSAEDCAEVLVVSREQGVLAGLPIAKLVFKELGKRPFFSSQKGSVSVEFHQQDGTELEAGTHLATIRGPLPMLLSGERTVLNFLTHLSGIASVTAKYVSAISGSGAEVLDTRKTHPGYRMLEKYAVRCGGGANHRIGLYDAMMIKDNHIAAWKQTQPKGNQTLQAAIRAAQEKYSGVFLIVEVDTESQLEEVLPADPNVVLLDNMSLEELSRCVKLRDKLNPKVLLEASGGVTLQTIGEIARTGVERISVGALTHSAPAYDIGFDWSE